MHVKVLWQTLVVVEILKSGPLTPLEKEKELQPKQITIKENKIKSEIRNHSKKKQHTSVVDQP